MSPGLYYFEDLSVGQRFRSGTYAVDADQIKAFARAWDPQPFHLDEEAAARTVFGGLVASGWHTVAITMRLLVTGELRPANGILGLGVEDLRWLKPVRPGDTLRVESEIVEVRPSMSRPDYGVVKIRHTTTNQEDAPVQVVTSIHLVARRPEAAQNIVSPQRRKVLVEASLKRLGGFTAERTFEVTVLPVSVPD